MSNGLSVRGGFLDPGNKQTPGSLDLLCITRTFITKFHFHPHASVGPMIRIIVPIRRKSSSVRRRSDQIPKSSTSFTPTKLKNTESNQAGVSI